MRTASLRLLLIAATAIAGPALAQEAPPVSSPVGPPPAPIIAVGPEAPPVPTIEAIPRVWSPSPRDAEGRTAYGLYLAGRSAISSGEARTGATYLTAVEALTPEQPSVQEQAFIASLVAGDLDVAARIRPEGEAVSPTLSEFGTLISVVQTFVAGDERAANVALKAHPIGAPHARAGVLIAPFIAAAAGDWTTALAEPNPTGDPLTVVLGRFDRALLLEHHRDYAEAETALKALVDAPRTAPLFRVPYGEFLERRGRRDEALALYDAAIAAGVTDANVIQARDRVIARRRAPTLQTYRDGVAEGLSLAAQQAASEGANEFAVVYLRLSLNLKRTPEALYRLATTLAQADLDSAAQAAFAEVPDIEPDVYAAARVGLGLSLDKSDKREEALAAYRQAQAATPNDPRIARVMAGALLGLERYDEALVLLNGPLLNTADQTADIRFQRGAAYESLHRIPEAEGELWAALQAEPDEPQILNYLGYLWVDSGRRVAEGAAMLERAHAAAPDDGNIQDSLGWAQFRQGQYDTAVDTLEQAVAKEPANPEINDHLGDAYWSVGRHREAGFQWNRVLTLDPDAERRAEVEKKLVDGLDL